MKSNPTISFEGNEPVTLSDGLPTNYNGPLLPGSVCYSAQLNHSELVLQELCGGGYSVRLIMGKFLRKFHAKGWIHTEGLYGSLMFKDDLRKRMVSLGETYLKEGQFSCFYTQPSDYSSSFEKGEEFCMVDLFYSPLLLEGLIPFFPGLNSVIGADPGVLVTQKPFWLPLSIKEITHQILHCAYNETSRQYYFDLKVKEILYCMLESVFKQDPNQLVFTPWEESRIHEARRILLEHITGKPPSIKKLSKLVALNEYKLKRGFRQIFNANIGQWMHEQKLQKGRHLILNTNKPIKEISNLVGYPLTTNFITAFRKHFGITPGDLRRK
ncbi:MAG: helix-turn-helix transcriptional regulator [Candidatus Kuenenia stuttgartiensis]|nr:helix-turn-helix transcriptional regulator [Candidatus Kuenenia stuttgartiensis]